MKISTRARRTGAALAGTLLAASVFLGTAPGAPAQEQSDPHWGQYQWYGGQEKADVRAFWLVDRTGNTRTSDAIAAVAGAWNQARAERFPALPYIAVHRDSANAGRCLVNREAGYSLATACTLPFPVGRSENITRLAGNPHLTGGAIGISPGLSPEQTITAVCHAIGELMGLEASDDEDSCMSDEPPTQDVRWYTEDDEEAVLDLYEHNEPGNPAQVTTTTAAQATTSTTAQATTSTTAEAATTTTVAPTTTTTVESTTTSSSLVSIPEVSIPDLNEED
jgi:hypothetical protein